VSLAHIIRRISGRLWWRLSSGPIELDIATPWLTAAIGVPKIPFGFEVEQSDKERLFLERSTVVRALFPGEYDVGARLSGRWKFLSYAIAVQNVFVQIDGLQKAKAALPPSRSAMQRSNAMRVGFLVRA